ncbi:uridine kinase [Actinokineospora baliensis]|uniref:hypothetical protein n=1 Tax=Actinokineospora baliensis TaxID=547056 RepID=UPI00195627A8|nr:hypothetical protein [Actinokineospora baliensis]MBM7775310.1 uridine kinase [Actinokineospora baliensis]
MDDFMVPVERRYWRGRYSAEGCYFDAHDWVGVCRFLLDPMGPGGDRRVRRTVGGGEFTAPPDAVLLFDGVFLLRPELVARWEMSIFVSVPLELTVGRALERGAGVGEIERSWRERYIPAQEFYYAKDRPADHADVVVFNEEFGRPGWVSR